MKLSATQINEFVRVYYNTDEFIGQRLGQAFYNVYLNVYNFSSSEEDCKFYNSTDDKWVISYIWDHFCA